MSRSNFDSWGAVSQSKHVGSISLDYGRISLKSLNESMLAVGNARCYGDEAYNDKGILLDGLGLNKFIEFNRRDGYITVEAGLLLSDILPIIVPCGWFLPVTPGTKLVTVGGAVANDVHGKNHHKDGSFGCFVDSFELRRSNDEVFICSGTQNSELFYATIGGMGLTGLICWVKFKLIPIANQGIISCGYKFANLDEYFQLNATLETQSSYTVAWLDCTARGSKLGRGIYFTGEHAGYAAKIPPIKYRKLAIPMKQSFSLINKVSLRAFNFMYYNRPLSCNPQLIHYDKFFYPLDSVLHWNRIYGNRGFYQYQAIVPLNVAPLAIREMLNLISRSGMGSFLAVLKTFGAKSSGGLMSFPREGVTLALDFANNGLKILQLFAALDKVVLQAKGAIYPAKDARMSSELFLSSFPNINQFIKYIDPKFESNLWQRVYSGDNLC